MYMLSNLVKWVDHERIFPLTCIDISEYFLVILKMGVKLGGFIKKIRK